MYKEETQAQGAAICEFSVLPELVVSGPLESGEADIDSNETEVKIVIRSTAA